jgi:hypothetical protein
VPVEVAVFQFEPRAVRRLGHEADLDLAGVVELGLELPPRADVPGEHHAVRRLVRQDAGPTAFAAVGAPVVDVTADARLEHGLRDGRAHQVVLAWLEVAEALREDREGPLDRRVHDDLPAYDHICLCHDGSSSAISW